MNLPQIFESTEFGTLRTMKDENGKTLFCGHDVAKILGYGQPNKAIERHCKLGMVCFVPHPQSQDKQIEMLYIPEGDVYRLIIKSKLPTAERFERWVFDEVLTSISKHGAYMTTSTIEALLQDPKLIMGLAKELDKEQQARRQLEIQIEEDRSKVMFAQAVSLTENTILIRELAKIMKGNGIDIGEKRLFEYMRKHGYLCKGGDSYNKPTQKAMNLGLFKIAETVVHRSDGTPLVKTTSKVTGKGQLYFLNKLQMTDVQEMAVL